MNTGELLGQKHSATSMEAARRNVSAGKQREAIMAHIVAMATIGATGDEIAQKFNIIPGTVSARLRDLEIEGRIVKTSATRLTRSKRPANVYVSRETFRFGTFTADTRKSLTEAETMRREISRLRGGIMELLRVAREGGGVHVSEWSNVYKNLQKLVEGK